MLQELSKIIGPATTKILQNQFKFAAAQAPKVALWGLPASVGGYNKSQITCCGNSFKFFLFVGAWFIYPAIPDSFKKSIGL